MHGKRLVCGIFLVKIKNQHYTCVAERAPDFAKKQWIKFCLNSSTLLGITFLGHYTVFLVHIRESRQTLFFLNLSVNMSNIWENEFPWFFVLIFLRNSVSSIFFFRWSFYYVVKRRETTGKSYFMCCATGGALRNRATSRATTIQTTNEFLGHKLWFGQIHWRIPKNVRQFKA
jgi:hypothetical protein